MFSMIIWSVSGFTIIPSISFVFNAISIQSVNSRVIIELYISFGAISFVEVYTGKYFFPFVSIHCKSNSHIVL